MICFPSDPPQEGRTHGRPQAQDFPRQTGPPAKSPPPQAEGDPVLPAVQRAGAAAPRLLQLRPLPGPRSRGPERGEVTAMQIALDAMGGDHAPGPIVAGAVQAVAADPDLRVTLVGDRAQVEPRLDAAAAVRDRLDIFHCTEAITMQETPVLPLRKQADNS